MTSKRVLSPVLALLTLVLFVSIDCNQTNTSPTLDSIEIDSSWPANGSIGVDVDVSLTVVFNAPMDKAATQSSFSISPATSGAFSWSSDSTTMVFSPTASLSHSTNYICRVSEAAQGADGPSSIVPFEFSFTTGLPKDTTVWLGNHDFSITGTTLAKDIDLDGNVDTVESVSSFSIDRSTIPSGSTLLQAFLYWGGSQIEDQGADQAITLELPNGSSLGIAADVVFHDDASSIAYDIEICRKV